MMVSPPLRREKRSSKMEKCHRQGKAFVILCVAGATGDGVAAAAP